MLRSDKRSDRIVDTAGASHWLHLVLESSGCVVDWCSENNVELVSGHDHRWRPVEVLKICWEGLPVIFCQWTAANGACAVALSAHRFGPAEAPQMPSCWRWRRARKDGNTAHSRSFTNHSNRRYTSNHEIAEESIQIVQVIQWRVKLFYILFFFFPRVCFPSRDQNLTIRQACKSEWEFKKTNKQIRKKKKKIKKNNLWMSASPREEQLRRQSRKLDFFFLVSRNKIKIKYPLK